MSEIVNVACGDDYTAAAKLDGVWDSGGGVFQVDGNAAKYVLTFGPYGLTEDTEEATIGLGGGTIPPNCTGIRFRNAVAGKTATVSALIRHKRQPHLSLSFPALATASMITGRVAGAGTIQGGSGFSVVRNSAGNYTVTYSTAFAAIPVVLCNSTTGSRYITDVFNPTVNGFTVSIFDFVTGANTDNDFDFVAQAVI